MSNLAFKGPIEGYVVNRLARDFWKVQRTMEWEDVMQEAREVFFKVSSSYPDVEDRHLMALFKTSWSRRFVDLARYDSDQRHVLCESGLAHDDEVPHTFDLVGEEDNAGMLALMVEQAPQEVKTVLCLFLSAPAELLDLAASAWRAGGKKKSMGNTMVNRLLGRPEGTDSLGTVERYFLAKD